MKSSYIIQFASNLPTFTHDKIHNNENHPFILLNNLISHTHFWLSANQIISYNVFIQIHKLKDKQCRSWSEASSEAIWSGSTLVLYHLPPEVLKQETSDKK